MPHRRGQTWWEEDLSSKSNGSYETVGGFCANKEIRLPLNLSCFIVDTVATKFANILVLSELSQLHEE